VLTNPVGGWQSVALTSSLSCTSGTWYWLVVMKDFAAILPCSGNETGCNPYNSLAYGN
jgi:hypothetical protein